MSINRVPDLMINPTGRSRAAFSLVEVTMALGITAFCLLSLLSLLSVGMKSNRESREIVDASATASLLLEVRRSAPLLTTGALANWAIPAIPSGVTVATNTTPLLIDTEGRVVTQNPAFALTYRLQRVAANSPLCKVFLRLSTPARATQASSQTHYEVVTSIRVP